MARTRWSPLSLLLCAIFFFSANVLAVSAVLGVDLGTEYIKAALVKPGIPLEIVLTKDSRRKEISAVAFKPAPNGPKKGSYPERAYGSDAMALSARFPGDVFPNLKALLGLPADSTPVAEYAARHPALQLAKNEVRGTAAFKSVAAFTPEEEAFMVEELLAMELQSIRNNAQAMAGDGSKVRSVVITVPPFYTTEEKRAVELAAELAGLKVLSLISDSLAVGLNYATSRQFPNINEGGKPEYHMVFDMGAGSTKASVLKFQSRTVKDVGKFNKTIQEVQVLGSGWDQTLGGDALNYLVVDDMISQFAESPKAKKASVTAEGVKAHGRAIAKLTKEAERLRHVLSANQNTQASFEGLYEDVDFKYKITRADFETMAEAHAERVGAAIKDALKAANLDIVDLDSVILHGGASRTPFVQKELEKILGGADKIRTNVNSDEAAVFGAAFRAADISPSFRVKEIRISEAAAYPVGMRWKTDHGKDQHQRLFTAVSPLGAVPKEITFNNQDDFSVSFYQQAPPLGSGTGAAAVEANTKVLTTKNLTASVAQLAEKYKCEKADIKLKVGIRLSSDNGEVDITKAAVECETEEVEKETLIDGVKNLFGFGKNKDQKPLNADGEAAEEGDATSSSSSETSTSTSSTSSGSSSSSSASASASPDAKAVKTKKLVTVNVEFTLEKSGLPQLPKADLQTLKDRIKAFEASDKARRLREETLNQLEGFTYKVRDLLDNDAFTAASTKAESEKLEKLNSETSDWLYGDGADATREELKKRHTALLDIVEPIQKRIDEAAKRPQLIKDLEEALGKTKEFVSNIKEKITEYEAFQSSASIAASQSSTSMATDTSATASPSPTPVDDFAGLEDDDATSTTTAKARDMEDVLAERGPVPPLYTLDDLKESEDLHVSISAWLVEKSAAQAKLGPTDDPVLLIKDLEDRRAKLDKAGVDLAMKSVRNFEKKKSKPKKPKAKPAKKGKGKPTDPLEFAVDEELTQERLEEMLAKIKEQQKVYDQENGKAGSEEQMKEKPAASSQAEPAASASASAGAGSAEKGKEGEPRVHEEL